jgi:hypothetical protein
LEHCPAAALRNLLLPVLLLLPLLQLLELLLLLELLSLDLAPVLARVLDF